MYGMQTFKTSCGRGPHALLADCVQLMAARAKGSQIPLHFQIVGEVRGGGGRREGGGREGGREGGRDVTEVTAVGGRVTRALSGVHCLSCQFCSIS